MRNFKDTFQKRKRSFIKAFSVCMTVPLKMVKINRKSLICKSFCIPQQFQFYAFVYFNS